MFPAVDKAVADGKKIGAGVLTRLDSLIHEISQIRKEAPLWATQDVVSLPLNLAISAPVDDGNFYPAFQIPLGETWEIESAFFYGSQWILSTNNSPSDLISIVWREDRNAATARSGWSYYPRIRLAPGQYYAALNTGGFPGAPLKLQFRRVIPNPVPRQAISGSDNSGRIMLPDIQHEEYRDSVAVPSDLPQQQ